MFKSVPGCIEGIPGHYGMFRGVPGVFRGVPGCSGRVPGFTDTQNFRRFTEEFVNPQPILASLSFTIKVDSID